MKQIASLLCLVKERARQANPEHLRLAGGGLAFLLGFWLFPVLTTILCVLLFGPPALVIVLAEVEKAVSKRKSR